MNTWSFIILTALNGVSFLALLFFQHFISNIIQSHIFTLGKKNAEVIETRLLNLLRLVYSLAVIGLIVFSYSLFSALHE